MDVWLSPFAPWDSLSKNTGMGCHFLLQIVTLEAILNCLCLYSVILSHSDFFFGDKLWALPVSVYSLSLSLFPFPSPSFPPSLSLSLSHTHTHSQLNTLKSMYLENLNMSVLGQEHWSFAKSPKRNLLGKKSPWKGEHWGVQLWKSKPLLNVGIETEMMQIYNILLDKSKYEYTPL